jgi:flagellar hook assembly protein FlgD
MDVITLGPSNAITDVQGTGSAVTVYYQGQAVAYWDGIAPTGNPISNGIYYLKVDNVDTLGVVKSTTQQVTVNRSFYKTTIKIYNEAGEVVRTIYSYVDNAGQNSVLGVQLSNTVIEPGVGQGAGVPSYLTITLSNGTAVTWDGTSDNGTYVQNGQYFVEVHSVDGQGGETVLTKQVAVENHGNPGAGVVTAWPNLLTRNDHVMTFHTDSSQAQAIKISLYTVAGELVQVVSGDTGANPPQWDTTGKASGVYIAVAESRDANGKLLGRQTFKVEVIH